jgi:pyruvate formate lyase activating enzyme
MDRRLFIKCLGCSAAAAAATQTELLPEMLGGIQNAMAFEYTQKLSSVEARYYDKLNEGGIECRLCPRRCRITDLERGYCGVRENRGDKYITLVYGLPCAVNIDPIEKKPLFHFYPGTSAFSLATAGCNCNCKFCQNWDISQSRPEQTNNIDLPPGEIVKICQTRRVPTIAYTYSEPIIFYEYMYDTARLAHEQDIKSVMITGGYIEKEPLTDLLPQLDAVKVDLKSIRETFYKNIVNAELQPVLEALVEIKKAGVWLEIVNLVVPTLNDTDEEFRALAGWVRDNLGGDIALHFSRFHGQYLLKNLPSTPETTLQRAHDISRAEGLDYVYLGNLYNHPAESTYCPRCRAVLIQRQGYRILQNRILQGRCPDCHNEIPGHF